jgi:hypothetical protein
MVAISSALRCSIGICPTPSEIRKSIVGDGSAIERHAAVVRGERLEVRPDLIADVAIGGDAIGTGDDEIDHSTLHQMTAGIVRDHRMRHAMMRKLLGRQRSSLVLQRTGANLMPLKLVDIPKFC